MPFRECLREHERERQQQHQAEEVSATPVAAAAPGDSPGGGVPALARREPEGDRERSS